MKSTDLCSFPEVYRSALPAYSRLDHPVPALTHANYPYYTEGGSDKRWLGSGAIEEGGLQWVGGLMCIILFFITREQTKIYICQADRTTYWTPYARSVH